MCCLSCAAHWSTSDHSSLYPASHPLNAGDKNSTYVTQGIGRISGHGKGGTENGWMDLQIVSQLLQRKRESAVKQLTEGQRLMQHVQSSCGKFAPLVWRKGVFHLWLWLYLKFYSFTDCQPVYHVYRLNQHRPIPMKALSWFSKQMEWCYLGDIFDYL